MLDPIPDAFALPYVQRATVEILLLAVASGLIGPWIVLRSLSFYSHAAGISTFPGLVVADGIGLSAQLLAFGTVGVFTALVAFLGRIRNAATDAVTALALVGSLAVGVILASDVFGSGANVDSLLFGSLLSIGAEDLAFAAGTALLAVIASTLFSRHWLVRGFDETTSRGSGSGSRWFDLALLVTVAMIVIAALNAVGALLVIALLVVPAATVRLVTRRIPTLRAGTTVLAAVEGVFGVWLSVETNVPPGATIAVLSGVVFGTVAVVRALGPNRRARRLAGLAGVVASGSVFLAGCGSGGVSGDSGSRQTSVVATTTQVADVVREVGGSEIEVTQLLQPNTDPHDYEPRPSDVEALPDADVVFINGGHMDEWVEELIDDSGSEAKVVNLGEGVPVRLTGGAHDHGRGHGGEKADEVGHGHGHGGGETDEVKAGKGGEFDSHWWHDPKNVEAATARVEAVLARLDPRHRTVFAKNARAFERELVALDEGIRTCLARIPREDRKLVTDHEAFGYLANRYGIEVIGTVIPALTTQAEPSAGDLAELETTIRSEGVEAVFPESSVPSSTAEAISRDTGATSEYVLYGDSLGAADSDAGTYLGMMEVNADQIARGLSGGKVTCDFR